MFTDTTIHSYGDARRIAALRLPWMVFDYIDGAAGTGHGEAINLACLRDMRLQPRVLNNVEQRSISVEVFGQKSRFPFGISPMGMCNLAGPDTDRAFADLARDNTMPVGVSTAASTSLEVMAEWSGGNAWFQLYFSGKRDDTMALLERAKTAGYKTLVMTVDVPEVGRRPRELRRGFAMPFKIGPRQFVDFALHPRWSLHTLYRGKPELANFGGEHGEFDRTSSRAGADWDLLKAIRDAWPGNLVVKGVLDPRDAVRIRKVGADAIQVSSHGGRQLDSAPAPILALGEIRKAVGAQFPLFFDSGIRSGEDIIKAYAIGANFVFLGRGFSYAAAAAGQKGVRQFGDVLCKETSIALAQLGLTGIEQVDRSVIADQS